MDIYTLAYIYIILYTSEETTSKLTFRPKTNTWGARLSVLNAVVTPDPVICESLHILLIWKTLA